MPARDVDGLLVLRHTRMNPWLHDNINHIDYIEKYCLYLEQLLRTAAPAYQQSVGKRPAEAQREQAWEQRMTDPS